MSNIFLTEDKFIEAVAEIKNSNFTGLISLSTMIDKVLLKERVYLIVDNYQLFRLIDIIFTKIAESMETGDPWKNSVDPLTFILGAAYADLKTLKEYAKTEEIRQKEKSVGTKFGYFHQGLLRIAFDDKRPIEDIFKNKGKEFDVLSGDDNIAIEVKSKWNTTKGDTRTEKYKEMWGMRKSAKEIYFAEIIGQPKKNNFDLLRTNLKDSLNSNSDKTIFEKCNGEYIYQRAAKYNNLNLAHVKLIKNIFENFPFVIWLYSQIFLKKIYLNLHSINEKNLKDIIKSANSTKNTESDTDKKNILNLISHIGNQEYENVLLFECKSRKLLPERKKVKTLIIERDQLQGLYDLTTSVSKRIENFLSNEKDLNFLNEDLIGHLYK